MTSPKPLPIRPLAPYEDRLLSALSFFRSQRDRTNQAHHCLSMYLRQSESRVMSEVGFYARRLGMSADELLELIYTHPEEADRKIEAALGSQPSDIFAPDGNTEESHS
jgi:cobalamin-dependent methionine synthase I